MVDRSVSNEPGVLYVVATPIGHLDDLSLRAIRVLKAVDCIAAEDTRHSRRLLDYHGIRTPMLALHEHNERQWVPRLVARLHAGLSLALISDAGTPLLSDPGFPLVRECRRQGIRVSPVPGASALLAALSASGLPTDAFCFHGFLPRSPQARRTRLEQWQNARQTQVFYESSHRIQHTLEAMHEVFGGAREVALARELTKKHETFYVGQLDELLTQLHAQALCLRGEFVVIVAPAAQDSLDPDWLQAQTITCVLAEELPLKQAVALAAKITGVRKNRLYRWALQKNERENRTT